MTHKNGQVKSHTAVLMCGGHALHCVLLLTPAVVLSAAHDHI